MKTLMATVLMVAMAACGGGGDDDGGSVDGPGGDGAGGGADSAGPGVDGAAAAGIDCDEFPGTLTSGPSISATQTGVVMCDPNVAASCRVTSNTYSDGEGACPVGTGIFFFGIDSSGGGSRRLGLSNTDQWSIVSTSHGTANDFGVEDLPDATEITIVFAYSKSTYQLVFEFQGQDVHFVSIAEQI